MKRTLLLSVAGLALALTMAGCGKEARPANLLDEETFITVYVGLLGAERPATAERDSVSAMRRATILNENGVKEQEFRQTMEWYHQEPERWKGFYQEVMRRLETPATRDTSGSIL